MPNRELTCTTYQLSSNCTVASIIFSVRVLVILYIMRQTYGKRLQHASYAYELPLSPHVPRDLSLDGERRTTVPLSTAKLLENVRRLHLPLGHYVPPLLRLEAPSSPPPKHPLLPLQNSSHVLPGMINGRETSQKLSQLAVSLEMAVLNAAPDSQRRSWKTSPSTGGWRNKSSLASSSLSCNIVSPKHWSLSNSHSEHRDRHQRMRNSTTQASVIDSPLTLGDTYDNESMQPYDLSIENQEVQTTPHNYRHRSTQTDGNRDLIKAPVISSLQAKTTKTSFKRLEEKSRFNLDSINLQVCKSHSAPDPLEYILGGNTQKSPILSSLTKMYTKPQYLSTFIQIIGKDSQGEESVDWEGQLSEWIQGLEVKIANHEKELSTLKKHWTNLNGHIKHAIREIESGPRSFAREDHDILSKIPDNFEHAYVAELAQDSPTMKILEAKAQCMIGRREKAESKMVEKFRSQRSKALRKKNYRRAFTS